MARSIFESERQLADMAVRRARARRVRPTWR